MTFKCTICDKEADIWYEYGVEHYEHMEDEPDDGHWPTPPEQEEEEEEDD